MIKVIVSAVLVSAFVILAPLVYATTDYPKHVHVQTKFRISGNADTTTTPPPTHHDQNCHLTGGSTCGSTPSNNPPTTTTPPPQQSKTLEPQSQTPSVNTINNTITPPPSPNTTKPTTFPGTALTTTACETVDGRQGLLTHNGLCIEQPKTLGQNNSELTQCPSSMRIGGIWMRIC
jgi:hypothetical protein